MRFLSLVDLPAAGESVWIQETVTQHPSPGTPCLPFTLPTANPEVRASNLYLSHLLCCCVPVPGADVAQQGLGVSLMKDEHTYGTVFLGRRIVNPFKGTCVLN